MKHLNVVFPYWESPEMLKVHLATLAAWPTRLRDNVTVLICDDCSENYPIDVGLLVDQPFRIEAFRITRKEPWNYRAAKNIAMHEAPDGWSLVTDIDHTLCAEEAENLFSQKLDREIVYYLNRMKSNGEPLNSTNDKQVMTKEMFWRSGGFDESFVGIHMGNPGERPARLKAAAKSIGKVPVKLTRYSRSEVGDEPDNLVRGHAPYAEQLKQALKEWAGVKTMTFPYERLL